MRFKGIHHVSINVRDLDEALEFYVDKLGLEILPRPDIDFPGYWLKAGTNEIHLLGKDSGTPVREQHFAFDVEELDEIIAELQAQKIKVSQPTTIDGVCRAVFIRDPSGNMIELNQRL